MVGLNQLPKFIFFFDLHHVFQVPWALVEMLKHDRSAAGTEILVMEWDISPERAAEPPACPHNPPMARAHQCHGGNAGAWTEERARYLNFRQPDLGEMNPALVIKLLSCEPHWYFEIKPLGFWDFYAQGSSRIKGGLVVQWNNPCNFLYLIPSPPLFFFFFLFFKLFKSVFPGAFSSNEEVYWCWTSSACCNHIYIHAATSEPGSWGVWD